MTAFWTLFWLGFIGLPLLFWLTSKIKSRGYRISSSHVMVYKGTNRKFSNATVKQAWEHENPGRTWGDHEKDQQIAYFVMAAVIYLGILAWLATRLFVLPHDQTMLKLFWQFGGPILGGASSIVFILFQRQLARYQKAFFRILHLAALGIMLVGVVAALVLTFLKISLPVSQYWLWAPVGVMGLSFLLDGAIGRTKGSKYRREAAKVDYKLEYWVGKVLAMSYARASDDLEENLWRAQLMLDRGELRHEVKDKEFFYLTEAIMLDLVNRKPIPIQFEDVYHAQDFIIKTVQRCYAYMVRNVSDYNLHPRIKQASKSR
jgi:hypothetical protein